MPYHGDTPDEPRILADAHMSLAVKLARAQRGNRDLATEDMLGICYLGLRAAADWYDPAMGPFVPYASSRAKGRVLHALRDASQVPGPEWDKGVRFPDTLQSDMPPGDRLIYGRVRDAEVDLPLRILLQDAIGELPCRQREVFLLRMAGYSFPEIGVCIDATEMASQAIWSKAKARLYRRLAPILPEYEGKERGRTS